MQILNFAFNKRFNEKPVTLTGPGRNRYYIIPVVLVLKMRFGLHNDISTTHRLCFTWSEFLMLIPWWYSHFSENIASYIDHLHTIFRRLDDNNLLINVQKGEYYASEVQYLGHSISSKGIYTIPAKLDTINTLLLLKSVTNLHTFLGEVNFYHMFISMASSLL